MLKKERGLSFFYASAMLLNSRSLVFLVAMAEKSCNTNTETQVYLSSPRKFMP